MESTGLPADSSISEVTPNGLWGSEQVWLIRIGLRSAKLSRLLWLGFGGNPAQPLLFSPLAVEFEEAGDDFIAEVVGPAVAPGLLAMAASGLVLVVVEEELTGRGLRGIGSGFRFSTSKTGNRTRPRYYALPDRILTPPIC